MTVKPENYNSSSFMELSLYKMFYFWLCALGNFIFT